MHRVSRTWNLWMLNWWYIYWPLGFEGLIMMLDSARCEGTVLFLRPVTCFAINAIGDKQRWPIRTSCLDLWAAMRLVSRRHQVVCVGRRMSQSKTLSSAFRGLEDGGTWRFAARYRGRRRRGLWPQLCDVAADPNSSLWRMAAAEDAALLASSPDWQQEMARLALKTCKWLLQRCAVRDSPVTTSCNCSCHNSWADTLTL